jgi:hypothetical protein
MLQAKVEALMDRLETPAILALRPYPPVGLPEVNSQLGGLPLLPSEADWPRASDGTPLHFLARIDCAELPHKRGPLPDHGILQFFARIDEEMIWDDPATDTRVLFTQGDAGRPAPPPADLMPIGEVDDNHDYDREMRLPDEPHTRIYPHWPLTFRSIRSWPQMLPAEMARTNPNSGQITIGDGSVTYEAYLEAVEWARAAEIVRTTGRPTNPLRSAEWGEITYRRDGKRVIRLPERRSSSDPEFPQAWIIAERIARAMAGAAKRCLKGLPHWKPWGGVDPERLRIDIEQAAGQAQAWVRRAQQAGLDAPMGEADAKAFMDWLKPLASDERHIVQLLVTDAVQRGMSYAIKYCGGSRGAAAIVPVPYMTYLEGEHSLTRPDSVGIALSDSRRRIDTEHHQLLGRAPTSQRRETRPNAVLLLHLVSDRGVDFMFCDGGEIQFWIDAADLAARRFENVRANTQGG